MKIKYIDKRFGAKALKTIESANSIIAEYQAQGFELTLRQLYYQFVSRDLIPNTQKDYKNLGATINDARLAGLVSWKSIVDRTRNLQSNVHWDSPREMVEYRARSYQIDKWKDQQHRIEVWVEKDALVGIVESVCSDLDVSFFSCRGYTSQSEMWSAGQRLKEYAEDCGQTPVIIHLGDHDPSGIDMSRDITDRLELFMGGMEVNRIALNMDQVRKYQPPPNPAKITDTRASQYIKIHGKKSWELDALEPKVLATLIKKTVLSYRDDDLWNDAVAKQQKERDIISKVARKMA